MKIVHVSFEIKPDQAKRYEATFRELRRTTLEKEAGCLFFEACRDEVKDHTYHVFEAYTDEDAILAHSATSYYATTARIFVECIAGNHMDEIKRLELDGRKMYNVVENIHFERFETIQ